MKKFFFVAAMACSLSSAFADETNATLSYQKLDEFFQATTDVNQSNLLIWMFVVSTNKSVHATNITLTIQSKTRGTIPVSIAPAGRIFDFPHTKELAKENPPIISNQPKGSLHLWIQIQIPMTNWLNFRYARLADGVAEMNKTIRAQAGWALSLLAPKVDSVTFYFPRASAGKAKVSIASTAGQREFIADKNGRIKLRLEDSLISENPEIHLSEKPFVVAPDMP